VIFQLGSHIEVVQPPGETSADVTLGAEGGAKGAEGGAEGADVGAEGAERGVE